MAAGRLELANEPGVYISGARVRWLLAARRAQLQSDGKLVLLAASPSPGGRAARTDEDRTRWTAYSSAGARNLSGTPWLRGYHMNGAAINRGQ